MAFHDTINTGVTPNDGQGDGLRTNIRKLHDNTKDNKQRLDDLNGNTPGVVSATGIVVLTPLDATKYFGNGRVTGAIKIGLPTVITYSMINLNIRLYNYQTSKTINLSIAGHPFANNWYAATSVIEAQSTTMNLPIRYGHDGTRYCIYIGELNTAWDYLSASVLQSLFSNGHAEAHKWLTGWSLTLETSSFQNITRTNTNNFPVAQ